MLNTILKQQFSFKQFHDHMREKDLREFYDKNEKLKRRSILNSVTYQRKTSFLSNISQKEIHILPVNRSSITVLWLLQL